jgi:O-antigen/teichoic acid export membrane protein
MRAYTKKVIANPLFSGSLIMIVGSNLTNALNYIYHLFMGRLLGPTGYGELASVFSLLGILAIIPMSFGIVVTKFVSASKNEVEVANLLSSLNKWIYLITLSSSIVIIVFAAQLAQFLNFNSTISIYVMALIMLFSVPSFICRSALQGVLKFSQMILSILGENTVKLFLGILLVYWGYSLLGALAALVIATLLGLFIARFSLSPILKQSDTTQISIKPLLVFSVPVIIQSLAMTSLYSSDVILVKHFFSSHDSGIYASLSTLGKIILFGSGPIAGVMFPIISKRHAHQQKFIKVFITSLLLTVLLALLVLAIFAFVPQLVLRSSYGTSFIEASSLLFYFGIFISLYTISSLFINYHLSIGNTKVVVFPTLVAIGQIGGIWFSHSTLSSVIFVSLCSCIVLLICLCIFTVFKLQALAVLSKPKNNMQ